MRIFSQWIIASSCLCSSQSSAFLTNFSRLVSLRFYMARGGVLQFCSYFTLFYSNFVWIWPYSKHLPNFSVFCLKTNQLNRFFWKIVFFRLTETPPNPSYTIPSEALRMLTTSIRSKWIRTPPLVPHGTFFTSSVCIVTWTLRNVVTNGIMMWKPGPLVAESKAPPWQKAGGKLVPEPGMAF